MHGLFNKATITAALCALLALTGCDDDESAAATADVGAAGAAGEAAAGSGGGGAGEGGAAGEGAAGEGAAGEAVVVDSTYYDGAESAALGASGNAAPCSTCHSNDGAQDGFSGNTFKDIAYRESYKGGGVPDLLSASNMCVTGWMGGEALLPTDAAWIALEAYLQSLSDPAVTDANALMPEVLADEAAYDAAYAGGDATAGEAVYEKACVRCHGGALTVNTRQAPAVGTLADYTAGFIAQKVRTSGPPPSSQAEAAAGDDFTPGPMPFFEEKDLSTGDLKDVIAYIQAQAGG